MGQSHLLRVTHFVHLIHSSTSTLFATGYTHRLSLLRIDPLFSTTALLYLHLLLHNPVSLSLSRFSLISILRERAEGFDLVLVFSEVEKS